MSIAYTSLLALGQPATGTESGTWGDDVNNAITSYLDIAIAGTLSFSGDGAVTLANTFGTSSATNIGASTAQYMVLRFTGTLTTTKVITAPSASKLYLVDNATSGGFGVTVKASGQTGYTVAANTRTWVYFNGTDYVLASTNLVTQGGTGQTSYTVGDILYASSTTALSKLPIGATNSILAVSGGIPQWSSATSIFQLFYPVGSIYINATNATNPGTLFGFGTWVAFGAGRVPVGFDSTNVLFDTAEETGGSADAVVVSHTHTITDPGHSHTTTIPNSATGNSRQALYSTDAGVNTVITSSTATTGISVNTAGSSGTNANYQPYITVYMWKRTA